MSAQKKIVIWQSAHEYPIATVMVTDNERYQTGRYVTVSIDEALGTLRAWLEKKLNGIQETKNESRKG